MCIFLLSADERSNNAVLSFMYVLIYVYALFVYSFLPDGLLQINRMNSTNEFDKWIIRRMSEWMSEWMNERTNERTNE